MTEILFSLLLIALIMTGMAIGVIARRKPIQGSCGGLAALGLKDDCEICGGDLSRCESSVGKDPQKGQQAYRVGN